MKTISLVLFFGFLFSKSVFAQDDYKKFVEQQNAAYQTYVEEVEKGVLASIKDYEEFRKREIEAYESFKKEMLQKWGDYKDRTRERWVEYKENGSVRSSVDFETGKVQVEIIVDSKEDIEKAKASMKETLIKTFEDKGSEREFPMPEPKKNEAAVPPVDAYKPQDMPTPPPVDKPKDSPQPKKEESKPTPKETPPVKTVSDKPILKDQLPVKADTPKEKEKLAEKLANENVKTKQIKGADGQERTVVYVDFDLAPDHIQKRAKDFQEIAHKFAEENKLSPALVFAIMHTESHFNPLAKSAANAYGLMQVVPTSAGRDAYKRIHKKDGVPTPEYLFTPDKNVQLGSVYLLILNNAYFSTIEDPISREYMIVCAYNTGAGNVAKAYNGTFNIKNAIPLINEKTAEQNYEFLLQNLPYEETRNYLKKVTERKKMYESWYRTE